MITTQDKELLAKKGITEAQIAEQLACFQTGFPYLKLDAAASIEKAYWLLTQKKRTHIWLHGMLIRIRIKSL